ncbi:EAL domain-containing protein [Poseidonibacter sp.]|uniref:EAL domain-containing protein n=2 Tax=Poseidonibacter sp. TaxID=2321188 RepID=UPI003C7895E9
MHKLTEIIKYSYNLNLLYVEDNDEVRNSTMIILREFFKNITVAENGQEGYERFTEQKFDLIMTDINMPKLGGLEMISKIRETDNEVLILVLSAYNEPNYFMESIKLGVEGYLLKPINMEQFLVVLNKVIQKVQLKEKSRTYMSLLGQYQEVTDNSLIVSKTDPTGKITYVNDEFCKISEFSKEELIGSNHNIIRDPENPKEFYEEMWESLKGKKQIWKGTIRNKSKSGKSYYVQATIKAILDADGNIVEYIALRSDITDIMNQQKQLEDLIDFSIKPILALIEIVDYNNLSKFYGHKEISHIETVFANTLLQSVPNKKLFDTVYTLSHGRFAFAKDANNQDIDEIIDNVKKALHNVNSSSFEIDGKVFDISIRVSLSYGDDILENCTYGLQKIKKGHSDFFIANGLAQIEKKQAQSNLNTLEMVHTAIKDSKIISYFQPIVDNKTKEIVKYESLVRLITPTNKILTPYFFLDVAKKGRFYSQITQIVFNNSFDALSKTTKDISINLSALDIEKENVSNMIFDLLEKHKKDASRIVFELLEDENVKDMNVVKNFISRAKKYGVRIAIDDFGVGYSNFVRLLDYQPDILKIDASLIKDILTNDYSLSIVKTIITFAKSQNIEVVGEFVENEEIYLLLKELGVDYSQGYFFGKPEPL